MPKRKLSAQFEILLRQVFPSITQAASPAAPQLLKRLPQVISLSFPLFFCLILLLHLCGLPLHRGVTLWAGNPFTVWRASAAVARNPIPYGLELCCCSLGKYPGLERIPPFNLHWTHEVVSSQWICYGGVTPALSLPLNWTIPTPTLLSHSLSASLCPLHCLVC